MAPDAWNVDYRLSLIHEALHLPHLHPPVYTALGTSLPGLKLGEGAAFYAPDAAFRRPALPASSASACCFVQPVSSGSPALTTAGEWSVALIPLSCGTGRSCRLRGVRTQKSTAWGILSGYTAAGPLRGAALAAARVDRSFRCRTNVTASDPARGSDLRPGSCVTCARWQLGQRCSRQSRSFAASVVACG